MDPDFVIGRKIIPAHRALNQAVAVAWEAVMLSALSQAAQTARPIIEENDHNVDLTFTQSVGGALSACLFDRAHFREGGGSPLSPADPLNPIQPSAIEESSRHSRAKRAMGGIANATRFACDSSGGPCPRGFVTARKLSELLPLPEGLGPLRGLIDSMPKWGQTRFLSYGLAKGFDVLHGGNVVVHCKGAPGR